MLHFPLHCTARFLGVGISCPITQNLSLRHLLRVHHAWCNTLRHSVFITYPPAVAKYNGEVRVYTVQLKATREREGEREIRSSAPFPSLVTRSASSAVSPEIKRKKKEKKEEGIWFRVTLLPFQQRCCSGSVARAGGWGSVRRKPPLYLKQPPSPLPSRLQEHYQHTGTHKWVRWRFFPLSLFLLACSL